MRFCLPKIDFDELKKLRHYLHAHPEISRQEFETAAYVRDYINQNAPPDELIDLAGAGFAVVYQGKKPGKTVLIRAELDALPIHEINENLPYRSIHDHVGHQCGHDGHMTMLTGLAFIYADQRPESGRVVLLYQPDEETGTGARECCDHPNFKQIAPDFAFSLHNFPNYPKHEILCKVGTFTSAVKFFAVKLYGKEAHSAMPETGTSPALAITEITQQSQALQRQFDSPEEYALIVPIHFNMGVSSSGVMPGYGEAHFTLRTCRNEVVDDMWQAFQNMAREIADAHALDLEFEIQEHFAANENSPEMVEMIEAAAEKNGLKTSQLEKPFRGGEDFGEITRRYRGAMFGLGAGNGPEIHNPDYDFPDDIVPSGIAMFASLIDMVIADYAHNNDHAVKPL